MKCLQQVEKGNDVENVQDAHMKKTAESVCSVKTRLSLGERERKRNAVSGKDVGFIVINIMVTNHPV